MDFNQLLNRMREIDSSPSQSTVEQCGQMPTPSMPQPADPQTPPPSMSVNLNAQGIDNIESMMKLFQKVNPDMMPQTPAPGPTLGTPPAVMQISPADQTPINKMLPDLSDEPEVDSPGDTRGLPHDHDKDHEIVKTLDRDGDGDHDMDDHELEKNRQEAYANEPDEEMRDVDVLIRNGDDLHKKKGTYPKVAGGDNPMQRVSEDDSAEARDYIRDMAAKIQSGELDADEAESEFFNTLSFYDMSDEKIMRAWDRITGSDDRRSTKSPSDDIQGDLKDLIKLTRDADNSDDNDDDVDQYRSQARSGGLGIDKTGFGTGLESTNDLRSQIREDLKQRLAALKTK